MPYSLHHSLKQHYCGKAIDTEVEVAGYRVDAVRRGTLIEVQTGNFASIRDKLRALVKDHKVLLVYPVASTKYLVKIDPDTHEPISRRRSPKRGAARDVFFELIRCPSLVAHPNFSLEVVLTEEEEVRCPDGRGSWRRKGVTTVDRLLVSIEDAVRVAKPGDLLKLLPPGLPRQFTTADLRRHCDVRRPLATRIAYCLRHADAAEVIGKQGNSLVYRLTVRRPRSIHKATG